MRIIAGALSGRIIKPPKGIVTHPMSERVRGGLFNALGDIAGLSVLDAFAGSGALSFEAVSRGASTVTAIDIDKKACETMRQSAKALGVDEQIKIIRANASGWSDNNPEARFDIVIAAPPYDNLQPQLVAKLTPHVALAGLYVLDWPGKRSAPQLAGFRVVADKAYGDAQLVFYGR